jgi:hypothetical protein
MRSHGKGAHGQCTCDYLEIFYPLEEDSGPKECQAHFYY